MQEKGIVKATREHPARFSAVSFEKILDLFIETKIEQAKAFQTSKEELLSNWRSLIEKETKSH
jgi:sugar-specific transcriptional regulator TrmB